MLKKSLSFKFSNFQKWKPSGNKTPVIFEFSRVGQNFSQNSFKNDKYSDEFKKPEGSSMTENQKNVLLGIGIGVLLTGIGFQLFGKKNEMDVGVSTSSGNDPKGIIPEGGYQVDNAKKRILSESAHLLQQPNFAPIRSIHNHLCAFHCYCGELDRQVLAHHYCYHLNDDLAQCVIYDGDGSDARLIGIEYVISEKLFKQLPDDEKMLWHSHVHEVKSGELITPHIPQTAEDAFMKDFVKTYGKTFHTWQVDKHSFPYGIPQLMMSFTEDGQVNQKLVRERDEQYGDPHLTEKKRNRRKNFKEIDIDPLADSWRKGSAIQTTTTIKKFDPTTFTKN